MDKVKKRLFAEVAAEAAGEEDQELDFDAEFPPLISPTTAHPNYNTMPQPLSEMEFVEQGLIGANLWQAISWQIKE